jgi:small GTP-binding protein
MKLLLIGNSKTGKTNFMSKYLQNKLDPDSKATILEFGSKCFRFENFIIKFQIWDTTGLERYKTILDAYYRGSSGVFIFYDITDKNSFNCIDIWFKELKRKCEKDAIIIIIGNKSDLEEKRQVTKEEGESKAKQLNAGFFETSALTGEI